MTDLAQESVETENTPEENVDAPAADGNTEQDEGQQEDSPSEDQQPDPTKKLKRAIERRNKKINKLLDENNQYGTMINEIKSELDALKNPAPSEPREEDFETYGEYLKALAVYGNAPAKTETQEAQQPLTREDALREAKQQLYVEQQKQKVAAQADRLISELPDYKETILENQDILDSMPEPIQMAFLQADNGALAFYSLAKNDVLEDLAYMDPVQAAMVVARADIEAKAALDGQKVKPSAAPAPVKAASGAKSKASKPLAQRSSKELLDWLNS